jgi:hypothetical protein
MSAVAALIYSGHRIGRRDDKLCLTDMWRAAGGDEYKRPARWLDQDGPREFIQFISDNLNIALDDICCSERGRDGATWAHWQIGLAYAKYLSPEFHAWCNEVVRAHMEGSRSALPTAAPPMAAYLEDLFDRKLALVHQGVATIGDNVVYIRDRIEDVVPRHKFSPETRKAWLLTTIKYYDGYCPTGCGTLIVRNGEPISGVWQDDHWYTRERCSSMADGWPVCKACNLRLRDSAEREATDRQFQCFQVNLERLTNKAIARASVDDDRAFPALVHANWKQKDFFKP